MESLPSEIIQKINKKLGTDDNFRLRFVCRKLRKALSVYPIYPIKCYMCGKIGPHTRFVYFFDTQQEYLNYPNYMIRYVCTKHDKFVTFNKGVSKDDAYNGKWTRVWIQNTWVDKYEHPTQQSTGHQRLY